MNMRVWQVMNLDQRLKFISKAILNYRIRKGEC